MKNKILILLLFIAVAGCKKKDPDAISGVYLFPQEVKDYTLFLPGTYWIYKDSVSGIEDCVYVKNCSMGIDTIASSSTDGGKEVVEFFGYETGRTYDNFTYSYSSNTSFSDLCIENNEKRPCFWTNRDKYGNGNYFGGGFCFLYEFYLGYSCYSGFATSYSRIEIINRYNLYETNGISFKDVIQFYDSKNITENDNRTNFYFAKNIGIIRKELLDSNQTWNLIRYHINQ